MDYRQSSSISCTPRRKDTKIEAYGGLQLKTRNLEDDTSGYQRQRRNSQVVETEYSQGQPRRFSMRRDSMPTAYTSSKYVYETKQDEPDSRYGRDEQPLKELTSNDNRQVKRYETKDLKEDRQDYDKEPLRGSYMNHRRNQMILKETKKTWAKDQSSSKKEATTYGKKTMDPQLVEKLYSISKLNSRISERLKNMSMTMEKFRV